MSVATLAPYFIPQAQLILILTTINMVYSRGRPKKVRSDSTLNCMLELMSIQPCPSAYPRICASGSHTCRPWQLGERVMDNDE